MTGPADSTGERPRVDGKFFRIGPRKFHPRGVTYGPFAPNASGEPLPTPEQATRDFLQIRELGANLLRVYHPPPRWFLDLAYAHDLRLMVDVPWDKHRCFLDDPALRDEARRRVGEAARRCAGHPGVFALSVVNEIPADIVRWSGGNRVEAFVDELVAIAKAADPGVLCTFGNFPPTEFLQPRAIDFVCFNVYLHEQRPFESYLSRLQMLADSRPLVLGEMGIDTRSEGEARQAEILGWQVESAFRSGCAGVVLYAYTDDWFNDNRQVDEWAFGLTRRDRTPKPAFDAIRRRFATAPLFPLPATPRVSVVVASYNGASTLRTCLQSLAALNYPDYEVILVDDGSTDTSPAVAAEFPGVRTLRHPRNEGLSTARNTGIEAATGEIVAFTDADCRADEDWLHHLVGDLLRSGFVGMGGHNLLPSDDSAVAAAVMASPGGPAHVMLDDRVAEHIPGCNMAFHRWALVEIGGFDPLFRRAGDDVDVCWRLQQRGYRIGFSPAGFVWHYRRNTVNAYLRQQSGYGEAEALLERRHPENFNRFGGSIWRGRIYTGFLSRRHAERPIIYHGLFGSAPFQSMYTPGPGLAPLFLTSLEYHVLVTLPLLVLGAVIPHLATVGVASLCTSLAICTFAGYRAGFPPGRRRFWSAPLVAWLHLLQPVVRGWARHRHQFGSRPATLSRRESLESLGRPEEASELGRLDFWRPTPVDRVTFLKGLLEELDRAGWPNKPDAGWSEFDLEIYGSRWASLRLTSVSEYHGGGSQLLRCRLAGRWSPPARALFLGLTGALLVVIGFTGIPWLWTLLLLLPLLAWRFTVARRSLVRVIATLVEQQAAATGFVRLGRGDVGPKP